MPIKSPWKTESPIRSRSKAYFNCATFHFLVRWLKMRSRFAALLTLFAMVCPVRASAAGTFEQVVLAKRWPVEWFNLYTANEDRKSVV